MFQLLSSRHKPLSADVGRTVRDDEKYLQHRPAEETDPTSSAEAAVANGRGGPGRFPFIAGCQRLATRKTRAQGTLLRLRYGAPAGVDWREYLRKGTPVSSGRSRASGTVSGQGYVERSSRGGAVVQVRRRGQLRGAVAETADKRTTEAPKTTGRPHWSRPVSAFPVLAQNEEARADIRADSIFVFVSAI